MNQQEPREYDLAEIPGLAWAMLVRAVKDRKHAFRTPVLCSVGLDGLPRARTVVLRHADQSGLLLRCHTDRRAGKVEEISSQPMVTWLFYDAKARTQLRIRAQATVHVDGPVFEEAWERTPRMSRRCYLAPRMPGSHADGPTANLPDDVIDSDPDETRSEDGREHFAVVATRVRRMDWLLLAHNGHRRATFEWDENRELSLATWIEP